MKKLDCKIENYFLTGRAGQKSHECHAVVVASTIVTSDEMEVVKLSELCVSVMLHRPNLQTLMDIAHFIREENHPESSTSPAREKVREKLRERMPLILELCDRSVCIDYMGEELFQQLESEVLCARSEVNAFKARVSAGSVVDRQDSEFSNMSAASGDKTFFPLEALLQGKKWPIGIDPKRREDYLSDDEFLKVFGMEKMAFFTKLSKMERLRKKKVVGLF